MGAIDLTYLERLFKGDRVRIHAWIRIYLEEAPAQYQRLVDAVALSDARALALGTHELRPQAHYLGTPRMLDLLTAVEKVARTGDTTACEHDVAELIALGEAASSELRALLMAG